MSPIQYINTGVLVSPLPYQEGNKLKQPNSNFCKPLKKKKFGKLSVQPGLRGSNDLRVGRKMATFQLLFQSGRAKDLSAPLYTAWAELKIFLMLEIVVHIVVSNEP